MQETTVNITRANAQAVKGIKVQESKKAKPKTLATEQENYLSGIFKTLKTDSIKSIKAVDKQVLSDTYKSTCVDVFGKWNLKADRTRKVIEMLDAINSFEQALSGIKKDIKKEFAQHGIEVQADAVEFTANCIKQLQSKIETRLKVEKAFNKMYKHYQANDWNAFESAFHTLYGIHINTELEKTTIKAVSLANGKLTSAKAFRQVLNEAFKTVLVHQGQYKYKGASASLRELLSAIEIRPYTSVYTKSGGFRKEVVFTELENARIDFDKKDYISAKNKFKRFILNKKFTVLPESLRIEDNKIESNQA